MLLASQPNGFNGLPGKTQVRGNLIFMSHDLLGQLLSKTNSFLRSFALADDPIHFL